MSYSFAFLLITAICLEFFGIFLIYNHSDVLGIFFVSIINIAIVIFLAYALFYNQSDNPDRKSLTISLVVIPLIISLFLFLGFVSLISGFRG